MGQGPSPGQTPPAALLHVPDTQHQMKRPFRIWHANGELSSRVFGAIFSLQAQLRFLSHYLLPCRDELITI
jgi:hypothetical protein